MEFTLGVPSLVPKLAMARAVYYQPNPGHATASPKPESDATPSEVFQIAIQRSKEYIMGLLTIQTNTNESRDVLRFYLELLDDPILHQDCLARMLAGASPTDAIEQTMDIYANQFQALDDAFMQERAKDIRDVRDIVLSCLHGSLRQDALDSEYHDDFILLAERLTVPQLTYLSQFPLKGILCAEGSATSHVAIVARALDIPAWFGVTGLPFQELHHRLIVTDGIHQTVTVDPTESERTNAVHRLERQATLGVLMADEAHEPVQTKDGYYISILANISSLEDAKMARSRGADGVGLFRTELFFAEREKLPIEDEQFVLYEAVAAQFEQPPFVVRLLDIGGDKPHSAISIPDESNPFLGLRGVRLLQAFPDILRTQLSALLRVSTIHPISILIPMVTNVDELLHIRGLMATLAGVMGVPLPRIGIMVEVPSTAVMIESYLPYVDFVSIGTNDLTQYTLACDRTNEHVRTLYQEFHPAVLRLISHVTRAAVDAKVEVCVCCELAGHLMGALLLVGLDVPKLSMVPTMIAPVKSVLRDCTREELRALAQSVLTCSSAQDVQSRVRVFVDQKKKNNDWVLIDT